MNRFRKLLMGTVAVIATATVIASMSTAAIAKDIRFTLGEYSANTKISFEKAAAAFEAEHPDIDIIIEVIPWSNYLQTLTTDISGDNAPDMSVVASIWLAEFAAAGLVAPIEETISPDLKGKFIPGLLGPSMVDGKLMALPIAASARAMMINTDLYNQAKVLPPVTWEELDEASKKIAAFDGKFGFGLPGKEEEVDVYFYYALWSFGGKIFDENGKSAIASPEGIAAAELYAKLVSEGSTQPSPTAYSREDVFNMFKQGKVGSIFTFPMLVPQLKEEAPDVNYAVLPFPIKAQQTTMAVTDSVMVFESSEAKEEIRLFMDFIFEHNFRLEFNKADGLLPVVESVAADPYFQQDKDLKPFADGLAYAQFQPIVERYDEVIDITRSALQKIYLGEQTPEEALTEAASAIDTLRGM